MTALREGMIEDLGLHGLSEQTRKLYVAAVQKPAKHCHKSPDQITDEELREYFLHLSNVQYVSASTLTVALCGIRFFYDQKTLHHQALTHCATIT